MSAAHVVTALPVVDELVTDEGSVVLAGRDAQSHVLRLSLIGTSVRELTRDGMPLGELAAHLAHRFGAPEGDALTVVAEVVATLAAQGMVSVDELDHP